MINDSPKHGFTILELVVVIIIVGVLASVALPRFVSMIERTRAVEAVLQIKVIREAMERCKMLKGGTFQAMQACAGNVGLPPYPSPWPTLALDDPASEPGSHFTYSVVAALAPVSMFVISAKRNTLDAYGPSPGGTTSFTLAGFASTLTCDAPTKTSYVDLIATDTSVQLVSCGFYNGMYNGN